jgi:hypothetical protein
MNTDAIKSQIYELEELRRQARRTTFYTAVGLVLIAIISVGAILHSMYSLTRTGPKQDEFIVHLGARLQTDILPVVRKCAEDSVKHLKPTLEAELKELDTRAPKLAETALREILIMGTNVPTRAAAVFETSLNRPLEQREQKLRHMYPSVTDAQMTTLVENVRAETEDQLARTAEKLFNPHLNSIDRIMANVDKIANSEPANPKQDIDSWQVAFLFLDVFTHEFKDLGADAAHPKETSK